MSFSNLDRRRYEYVLSLGADDDELARFFSESRAKLILHGGKVQNLPHGHKARVRAVAQLPTGTDKTVSNWFRENLTMADPMPPADIVEEFALHEQLGESPNETEAKHLCRSCLVHIYALSPPDDLMAFLRSPIGGRAELVVSDEPDSRVASDLSVKRITADAVADIMLAFLDGKDIERGLDAVPSELATFLQALQLAQRGDLQHARQLSTALHEHAGLLSRLSAHMDRLEQRQAAAAASRRGIVVKPNVEFSGDFNLASDAVVGYCITSDKSTAVFVRPIAVLRSGDVMRLRGEDAERLFPESGDLIAFAGPGYPQQPTRGDIGLWGVVEHPTDRKTHFHITSEKRSLHEVIKIPFPSSEPDSVRHYLLLNAKPMNGCVYELEDGLVVAARPERPDLTREEAFESGLRAWEALAGFRVEGRLFAIGPLPQEHLSFECAPLQTVARAVLHGRTTTAGALSKAQLRELARVLEQEQGGRTRHMLLRVSKQLDQLAGNSELMEALAVRALELPDVKKLVDQEVSHEVSRRTSEREDLTTEIAKLAKEREQEEERLRKLRDDQRRLKDETSKAVRAVFERAKSAGIVTVLAEAALYAAANRSEAPIPVTQLAGELGRARGAGPNIRFIEAVAQNAGTDTVFKRFGVSKRQTSAFVLLNHIAKGTRLMLELKGRSSSQLLLALAEAGALGQQTCLVETTVGFTNDAELRRMLDANTECDSVVLRDADLSPIELYARSLVDCAVLEMSGSRVTVPRVVYFNRSRSVAALPISDQISQICLPLDLDTPLQALSDLKEEDVSDALTPTALEESLRLLPLAAVRLSTEVQKLDAEQRRIVYTSLHLG